MAPKQTRKSDESPAPEVDEGAEAAQSDEWALPGDDPAAVPTEATSNPYGASTIIDADVTDDGPDPADEPEAADPGSAPGPAVIDGKTGTVVDSADPSLGKLAVEVRSNVTLGNEVLTPFRKVDVPDDAEARACIAVGHLRLLEDDEQLDVDNPEHADYVPF